MISIDPQASLKYFRNVAAQADRDVQQRLDRFQQSLETWLHSALNWPLDDWQADLRMFLEHTRYAGWEISPHSLSAIRELLTARAGRTGPFAAERSKAVDRPVIQLAAVMAPGEDTDATLDLTSDGGEADATPVDLETAGPDPDVSESFKAKVQAILELLDPLVAGVWKTERGIIRSRDASGWRFNYYSQRIDGRPAIIVDHTYSASDTALAILEEAYASGANPIKSEMLRRWISGEGAAVRLQEIQSDAFKEAAAEAAMVAELYYGSLSSLTPGGDLVATLDDIDRNGISLSHALLVLPAMAYFGKKLKRLILRSRAGKAFEIPKQLLASLNRVPKDVSHKIIAEAEKAKTPGEAIDTIRRRLAAYGDEHHISSDKNVISTISGGPWTPRFESIFKKAGMTLQDAENKLRLPAHQGPHPKEYHQTVYNRLIGATDGKSGDKYRSALIAELDRLAEEIATPGTTLNRLTKKK